MKNLLILIVGLLLATTFSQAQTVIRVRNGTNIQTLVNSETFVSGTVLLLDPGSYGDVEFKKRVSLIGSASFTGTNANNILHSRPDVGFSPQFCRFSLPL